ncbi:MAG: hypothetical protein WCF08_09165 [Anaerolineaceae bacterium]
MYRVYTKSILVGFCLAIITICILSGFALMFHSRMIRVQSFPTAIITKMAVPTSTNSIGSTDDINVEPTKGYTSIDNSVVSIGSFVQITGTGGVGLRMRLAPGTENAPQFIAMENEVFEVKDGPVFADDFNWWLLASPYDNNRQGWAAGQYLTVIKNP